MSCFLPVLSKMQNLVILLRIAQGLPLTRSKLTKHSAINFRGNTTE